MIERGLFYSRAGLGLLVILAVLAVGVDLNRVIGQTEGKKVEKGASGRKDEGTERETYYQMVLRTARDGSISERAAAINRLGQIGFAPAIPVLRRALDGEATRLHTVALDAASKIGVPAAFRLLVTSMNDGNPIQSSRAAFLLVERFPERAVNTLFDGMGHASVEVRRAAFTALEEHTGFRFGYDPDAPETERTDALTRWRTWWKRNRSRSSAEWWLEQVTGDREEVPRSRRIRSIDRLVEKRSWEAVPALIDLLDHPDEAVRVRATRGLRTLAVRGGGYDPLGSVSGERAGIEDWQAWWSRSGGDGRFSWLITNLTGDSAGRKNRLRDELVQAAGPDQVPALLDLISSDRPFNRFTAILALREVTGFSFGYRRDDPEGRRIAAVERWKAWGARRNGASKRDWMAQVLEHGTRSSNREAAATFFREVRTPRSVTLLIRHGLTDRRAAVRHAAFESLTRLTGRTFQFDPEGRPATRAKKVRQWKRWWEREEATFFERGPSGEK